MQSHKQHLQMARASRMMPGRLTQTCTGVVLLQTADACSCAARYVGFNGRTKCGMPRSEQVVLETQWHASICAASTTQHDVL